MVNFQNLVSTTHGRMQKGLTKTISLKYQEQHGIKNLNFPMDLIPYQIFRTILSISLKSMKH